MSWDILIYHYYGIEGVYLSWIASGIVAAIGLFGKWHRWW
jgi:hypothetical protein